MQIVILCGGKGTRAYPLTEIVPKPLLDVAGEPILGHLMRIYAEQGWTQFILSAGYLSEKIAEFASTLPKSWDVEVVDTGVDSNTGDRIRKVGHLVDEVFLANYADGLGDVDIQSLVDFHRGHPGSATLTTVPLPSQYGTIESDRYDRIVEFKEKPRLHDHRINGGFFVFDKRALDHFEGPDLERDVLPALSDRGELYAYRHQGFWKSMDTYKDAQELSALAEAGAPWVRRA